MGRPGLTVPTWNVLDKADTAKRVNISERTTEMIRIEETEHEFLLYIPASQKERAKAIRPREWDWKRVCWVYPRNSLVYCALRAEFGNDPAAKFAIAQPKFAGEKEKGQRQTEDVTSLRNSISQLRAKVRKLSEENKRLAADSERKASRMAESLREKELENDELARQMERVAAEAAKLSDAKAQTARATEDRLRKRESELAGLAEEGSQLRQENIVLSSKIDHEAAEKKQIESDMGANLKKHASEIAKLTRHNSRLLDENSGLLNRIKNGVSDSQLAGRVGGTVGRTELSNRPNRKALSEAIDIFRDTMRPFVVRGLKRVPRGTLEATIMRSLSPELADQFTRNLARHKDVESAIDVSFFPLLVKRNWRDSFSFAFQGEISIQNELWMIREARNAVSHPATHDFGTDFTGAYLYHIGQVLERINAPEQKETVKGIRAEWEESLGRNRRTH